MALEKLFDVVYTTKSGKTMIARRVKALSKEAAMAKLKKEMKASTTLDKIVMAIGLNGALPKGMTKAIAKNIKVTGLKKATGRLQRGFRYLRGGKIIKAKPKK